ncbi:MAG TPA: ABC transporter permease [Candidatus Limnocylindrales bacterium]|nr:ABC transporter permease [Candidatus Limnocylindrales bacterium]
MPSEKASFSERFFRSLIRVFPFDFQTNYGGEMAGVFREQQREAEARGGVRGVLRLWTETVAGVFRTAPREHWEILKQDCAYTFRMMRQNRGFTLIAILTLALGIGANTAIFSVVHAVLLSPLPYKQGQQLVFIRQQAEKMGLNDISFSVPEINDYREQNHTLASLVEYHAMSFTLFGHGDPARVRTGVVSWNYFDTFGIKPVLGRAFLPPDDQIGAPPVLLLSYEYWRNNFHGDPGIVGKTFEMNDKVHTVIGVLPPVPQYPNENDVYMPTSACPFRSSKRMIEGRDRRMMEVFGRLKPGVSVAAAEADLSTIAGRLEAEYPKSYPAAAGYGVATSSLRQELTQGARPTLIVLLAAAGFVLLIACANVANLTLSRMVRRERELAVRTALGAGRSRLLRQLLTESLVLALIGGAAGLLFAYDSLGLLAGFAARLTPRAREIHIDTGVLLFTLAAAVGVSILFGTLAAVSARSSVSSGLKEGSAGAGAGRQRTRVRSVLIVAQIAFSFILLIGAGLMLRSLYRMLRVNPGFVPQRVLVMNMHFNWSKYAKSEDFANAGRKILDRVKTEPGVLSAAISSNYPLEPELISYGPNTGDFRIEGRALQPGEAPPVANLTSVSPEYFQSLGIPLLEGRATEETDNAEALKVAVINDAVRRQLWPHEDPIGKRVSFDNGDNWIRIVGVVGDVREFGLDQPAKAEFYAPMDQSPNPSTLIVRTAADPKNMGERIRRVVLEVDSQNAITGVRTLEEARHESLAAPRLTASLLGLFAGLALLIAVAGIGGIMALNVSQRVREIGIRLALGARPSGIVRMLVGQGLSLALLGVGIGFVGALAITRLLKALLFEVTPTDPATFIGVAIVLIVAALLACFIPARRAASIDPNIALRCE